MDYAIARRNMVRSQITRRGVSNDKVISALLAVPRHLFVDPGMRGQAYSDNALPISRGQTISQPYIVAAMTEQLGLEPHHKVLEIGTGSGYQAAILARLVSVVYSIERIAELAECAAVNLQAAEIINVKIRCGDGTLGWPEAAPFDRIIVTAGAPAIPDALFEQLAEGGRLLAPVGNRTEQRLCILEKQQGLRVLRDGIGCVFVPLIGEQGWKSGN